MKTTVIILLALATYATTQECGSSLKPEKLVVVGVWKRNFDNSTAQWRISDEDLSVRGYERAGTDKASSTVMLARHPEGCVVTDCGVRLSAMMQVNGAILHTDHRMVRMNDSTMENIEDEFYCAEKNNSCGADVPIYRLVKHSLTGPHYAYSFDNVAQSLPGYEKEFFPLCYAWRQTPSVVLFNSSDDGVCLTLSETSHGRIIYSNNQLNVYSIGTTATLQCNHGFAGSGISSLLCTKDGWYPKGGLGSCEQETKPQLLVAASQVQADEQPSCLIPSSTPNGNVVYSANVAASTSRSTVPTATRATVLCSIGYVPTSSAPSSKCVNGEWQPSLPSCVSLIDLKCPILSAPRNGELVFTNSSNAPYSLDSVISLKCDRNYFGIGNLTATCTSTGWDQRIGQCEAVGIRRLSQSHRNRMRRQVSSGSGCSMIATVSNGNLLYIQSNPSVEYSSGSSAYLMCNIGYSLSGSVSSMCSNGVWSPSIGQCTNALSLGETTGSCAAIAARTNGTITYSSIGSYPSGTVATLTCNLLNTVSGSSTSTCLTNVWSPTLGTCVYSSSSSSQSSCANPTVLNGQLTYSQGNTYDITRPYLTTATLSCNSGYTLSGTSTSTCTGGSFTPTLGTCNYGSSTGTTGSTASCINPTVLNGQITYSQGSTYDITRPYLTTATLTCNSGYTLSGTSTSTCTGGSFAPTLGTCNLGTSSGSTSTCLSLTVLSGQVTYSQGSTYDVTRPYLTTATLTCNSGYTLSGSSTSTCSGGSFTPTIGTCNYGSSNSSGGLQCTAMIAPLAGSVTYSNGGSMGPFPSGTTVTGTCTNGEAISGSSTATCSNGMWSPTFLGTCSLLGGSTTGSCSALTVPSGAQATYSPFSLSTTSYTSGTVATVTCTTGGSLLGTSTCTSGIWSPSITSTCSSSTTTCSSLTRPVGETVTYDGTTSFATSFATGTVARVTCSNGTQIGQSTCYSGTWTPAISATCSGSSTAIGTQCIGAIVPTNSQITYSDGSMVLHSSGTSATLTCLNAATLSGNSYATCSNGVWTPTLGSCTSSSSSTGPCYTPPLTPTGATITYSSGYFAPWTAGSTATMTCPSGQTASGTTITYCTNSAWSPSLGTCSGSGTVGQADTTTSCSYLPIAPPYGSIVTSQTAPYSAGTVVTLQCDTGYSVQGRCTPLSAITGTLTNGRMTYTPTITATVPIGTTVNIVCYSGYSLSGTSLASCTSSGWSPSTIGSCVQQASFSSLIANQSCLAMSTPTYGTLSYSVTGSGPFNTGTTVTLRCDTNYAATGGSTSATCYNGVWSPTSLATCQRALKEVISASCPLGIAPVLGATVTYSNGSPLGPYPASTVATATCPSGYVANGIMSASCSNGAWTPASLGTCELLGSEIGSNSCGRLADILSGTLVYSAFGFGPYPSGTTVSALCNIGFTLSGQPTAVCTNGVWNPLPGTCVSATFLRKPPVKSNNLTLSVADSPKNGTADDTPTVVISGERCPPPIAPAFGEITFSGFSTKGTFEDGTTAALKCNLGYKTTGASFSTCRKGSFRPILGRCSNGSESSVSGVCFPLSPPKNSRVVYIQSGTSLDFDDGTTALLYCEEGFAVTGTATLQCQGGQWEPASGFGMCDSI
ncbi:unnamed protein product [Caenorhabditis sp. 36 PRJEB53466]|nr:unnamed protein product [Caenorhabditis sp. 36 PRJEB53466]